MVSKDISLDEKVGALSDDTARLLFTWMISHLDCEGRMYGDAKIFISIVAPRRSYSVKRIEKYLTEMEKIGLIERYLINGNLYLVAPKFEKHQTGLRKERESPSQIPPPTPDLLRQDVGSSPAQVKLKIKSNNSSSNNKDTTTKENNIYTLFEQEIGLLTPMITEQLKDAESVFPDDWIEDAIKEAARANVRKWSYIEGILKNWLVEGRTVPNETIKEYSGQAELISGQSIEKAVAIAQGKYPDIPKQQVKRFQAMLDTKRIKWR